MFKLTDYTIESVSPKLPQHLIDKSRQVLKDMDIDEMWAKTKGEGVKIAIIDTGIDTDHPDLKHAIKKTYNSFNGSTNVNDVQGHGTHVAGVIGANGVMVGVAPEAELYIVKALGDDGGGSSLSLAKGIEWCIEQDVDVISMSLGSQGSAQMVSDILQDAVDKNIIPVCAAGNDANGNKERISIDYPAAYKHTIAVGAIDTSNNHANFSSIGNVDVVAFGVRVLSTYKNSSYAMLSGTSMATPYISGAIALLQGVAKARLGRRLTLDEVKTILAINARDLGDPGKDKVYGYGEFSF